MSLDSAVTPRTPPLDRLSPKWRLYAISAGVVTICSLLAWGTSLLGLSEPNLVMIYLAGVALVAARCGHGPAIAAAILSVLVFDYFFVHPIFGFYPTDTQYFVTLSVMLGIGIVISELTARLQSQLRTAREQEQRTAELYQASQQRERRTAQLYHLSRQLSRSSGSDVLVSLSVEQIQGIFDGRVAIFLCDSGGTLCMDGEAALVTASTRSAARWVFEHHQPAGLGTDSHPEIGCLLVPMVGAQQTCGVLAVWPRDASRLQDSEDRHMLETCANLIALSLERDRWLQDAQQALVQVQSEQLRNALLSAVSHELQTPLATIAVTATGLLESSGSRLDGTEREMLQTVVDESYRLTRQVENLLDMARLDAGPIRLDRDWEVLEELVGAAIARLKRQLEGRIVRVEIPADLPLLWVADDLVQQVLINLLENAIRYSPPGSPIEISATHAGGRAVIRVVDHGPGLPAGSETRVFDKFFRGGAPVADGRRGMGLGLTICRAIVDAHGGKIRAANLPQGGAEFVIELPCAKTSWPAAECDLSPEHSPIAGTA